MPMNDKQHNLCNYLLYKSSHIKLDHIRNKYQ